MFPNQTSKPASERRKARLSYSKLVIQFVEEHNKPCCRKITGLSVATKRNDDIYIVFLTCSIYHYHLFCYVEFSGVRV